MPLALKRGDWETTQTRQVEVKVKVTKEDVKAMYSHGNLRDRALPLVLAQSGFSEVDVSCFKIEELKGLYKHPETEHYFIKKPREKTGEMQATCLSYEAMHDIRAMLQERGNPQEGYLFISTTWGKGSKLETRTINQAMKGLAEKGLKEKGKEFKTKALRSFYNSALLRANIQPHELKDLLMGHQRRGARKKYDYDEVTIKEAYQKAFENLSINGLQTRTDIAKLKEEFTETKAQLADVLATYKQELERVKGKLTFLDKYIGNVNEVIEDKADAEKLWAFFEALRKEKDEKQREAN